MQLENKIPPTPHHALLSFRAPLSFRAKREIFMPKNATSKISPFGRNDKAGLSKVYQLFGDELNTLIEQPNESLAA